MRVKSSWSKFYSVSNYKVKNLELLNSISSTHGLKFNWNCELSWGGGGELNIGWCFLEVKYLIKIKEENPGQSTKKCIPSEKFKCFRKKNHLKYRNQRQTGLAFCYSQSYRSLHTLLHTTHMNYSPRWTLLIFIFHPSLILIILFWISVFINRNFLLGDVVSISQNRINYSNPYTK